MTACQLTAFVTRRSGSCSRFGRSGSRCCSGSARNPRSKARGRCPAARCGPANGWARPPAGTSPPGGHPRDLAPGAAGDPQRPRAPSAGARPRDRLPRAGRAGSRAAAPRRHGVAAGGPAAGLRVRPRLDHRLGQGAAAREAAYTNIGFAIAPETFTISRLRDTYAAALGHPVSATNLQRILTRRGVIEPTADISPPRRERRAPGHRLPVRRPRAGDHQPLRRLPPRAVS